MRMNQQKRKDCRAFSPVYRPAVLSTFFPLLLLLVLLCNLISCIGKAPTTPADTTLPSESEEVSFFRVPLAEYRVCRPDDASKPLLSAMKTLTEGLREATGISSVSVVNDWLKDGESPDPEAKEILFGSTNRPQSAEALLELGGEEGYVICRKGNAIVINASDDRLLASAVERFLSSAFTVDGEVLLLKEDLLIQERFLDDGSSPFLFLPLTRDGKAVYTVIRRENANSYELETAQIVLKAYRDAVRDGEADIKDDFTRNPGESEAYEILIGDVNRTVTAEARASLVGADYAVRIVGHKILVTGSNATTDREAADLFASLLLEAKQLKGERTDPILILPGEVTENSVGKSEGFLSEIPAFSGGNYGGGIDAASGALEWYYTDVEEAAFDAYLGTLKEEGFVSFYTNVLGGNRFASFRKEGMLLHLYYLPELKAVRIITDRIENAEAAIPYLKGQGENPVGPVSPSVTLIGIDYRNITDNTSGETAGMSYVFTLTDGSFVIYDGGFSADAPTLYEELKRLNQRSDGIVISAWVLTHPHKDHIQAFNLFANRYGKECRLDFVLCNGTSDSFRGDGVDAYNYMDTKLPGIVSSFSGNHQIIKAHTGWVFCFGGAEIEILYTQEDLYPERLDSLNESSLVTRVTLGGQRIICLADIESKGGERLVQMYGAFLESEICQVAHHGSVGKYPREHLYRAINPVVLLWPRETSYFEANRAKGINGFILSLPRVKEVLLGDFITGNKTVSLPYPVS